MKKKELLKEEYDFILRLLGENDGIIEVKQWSDIFFKIILRHWSTENITGLVQEVV